MTFDGVITVASIFGILGFFLSVTNYLRLKPVIVIIEPRKASTVRDGKLVPHIYTFEIQNAGASGVSISAIEITRPGAKAVHVEHLMPSVWFKDFRLPLRLDAYDVYILTLDVQLYRQRYNIDPTEDEMDLVVEYYGRSSLWRILEWDKSESKFKLTSDTHRRLRSRRIRFSIANER